MTGSPDPSRRIPRSLDTDTRLFGRFTLTDLVVAGTPGALVVLLTQSVLPPSLTVAGVGPRTLTIPLAALALGLGGLFVSLAPTHTSSLDWLGQFVGFHRSERKLGHGTAKEYTQLERVLPRRDAVVRNDGTLVGAVRVDPPTMALATDEEWRRKTEAFQDFVNTTVEFPIQVYSTTQSFPTDEYLDTYRERLDDPDVEESPELAGLIENYIDWYETELAERRMTIRDHYVIVPVEDREVRFERDGLAGQVAHLPGIGVVLRMLTAPPRAEARERMASELDGRLRHVEHGLRAIDGVQARRLDASELTGLLQAFWSGEDADHENAAQRIRTTPFVTDRQENG